jgi:hypothetical protein
LWLYRWRSGKINTDTKSLGSAAAALSFSSIARRHHCSRLSPQPPQVPLPLPLPAVAACRYSRLPTPLTSSAAAHVAVAAVAIVAHLYLCIVLRCLCAECNKGAKLYFCAVFMIFIFFIGIHILFIETKDL